MAMLPFWIFIVPMAGLLLFFFDCIYIVLGERRRERNASSPGLRGRDAAAMPTSGRSDEVWGTGRGHDVEAAQTVQ